MAEPALALVRAPAAPRRRPEPPGRRAIPAPTGIPPAIGTLNLGGPGEPVPRSVAEPVSRSLGVDVSAVRVHSDFHAMAAAAAVGARAFAYGNRIVLGRGERATNLALMAHEIAHTVQQGGAARLQRFRDRAGDRFEREADRAATAVARGEPATVAERTPPLVQRLGLSDALDYFADKANLIPGFRMFTIVLGVNPVNQRRVERSAANILRALIEFIPGGGLITQAMDAHGVFDRVGVWVERQLATLGIAAATIKAALDRFMNGLDVSDLLDLGSVWERAKRIFTEPIDRIKAFAAGVVDGIVEIVKDAILRPLAAWASNTRGWDLLKAVLARDPITGDAVPRTAETLIGGFMKLIGQEEVWENIKRANAINRAWAWFQTALEGLMGFIRQVPAQFIAALKTLTITDILIIPGAFAKIARAFGDFVMTFLGWAGKQVLSLLEIIFEVLAPSALPYLRKAMGAFKTIVADPIKFVGNLVRAAMQGFKQFAANFLEHLKKALIGWLTGTLGGTGVYIPQGFNLREIIKFVLSVLGLTWQNLRGKLVKAVGETTVKLFETGIDIVVTLVRDGPAAAWEKIVEQLTNLRQMVIDGVMDFVKEKIVTAAVTKLISMLNPAGAFIQAVIAIYNTVMFLVERLQQIFEVAKSIIDSISAIAAGAIGAAANKVELTMGGLLTLVISFLARLVGLGKVSDAVKKVIDKVRDPIDKALDKVVQWIVGLGRRLAAAVGRGVQTVVGAVRGWLGLRQPFTTEDGKQHVLYFARQGAETRLVRASDDPTEVKAFLEASFPPGDPKRAQAENAIRLTDKIRLITRTKSEGTPTTDAEEAQITRDVAALAVLLARLTGVSADDVPAADWQHPGAGAAAVDRLSSRSLRVGSEATGDTAESDYVGGRGWVRMHLITKEVGGLGGPQNWVMAPNAINTGRAVLRSFETSLKQLMSTATGGEVRGRPKVAWVAVRTTFRAAVTGPRGPVRLPEKVLFRYGLQAKSGTQWIKLGQVSSQDVGIDRFIPEDDKLRLSTATRTEMRASGQRDLIDRPYSAVLRQAIRDEQGAGYGSYEIFKRRVVARLRTSTHPELNTESRLRAILDKLESSDEVRLR